MKIINICISAPYIDGFAYQENILTDYFLNAGLETIIIGSNILPKYLKSKKIETGIYFEHGKKIIRIKCIKLTSEFVISLGLFKHLKKERPDVIFHHNLNCTSLIICTIYRILNTQVVLLVDNHADYINCNQNKFWQLFYYKTMVRLSAKFSSSFVHKFYGVTLLRCDYLHEVYGVKKNKIDFLPIGADVIAADKITETKNELKQKYNIPENSFVFISGGKMGKDKGTINLVKAINEINKHYQNVYLVLFGLFNDFETQTIANESKYVFFKGWCNHETSLRLLKSADVAVWPIHHTTLIEDAISVNTPLLIRKTRTTEHLINGNGIFLESNEYNELYSRMSFFLENHSSYSIETNCMAMRDKLSYKLISQKVIDDIYQKQKDFNKNSKDKIVNASIWNYIEPK